MRRILLIVLFFLAPVLAACSAESVLNRLADERDRAMAESLLEAVRTDNLSALQGPVHPALEQGLRADMATIRSFYPPEGGARLVKVELHTATLDGEEGTMKLLTYEIGAGERWSVAEVRIFEQGNRKLLNYLFIEPAAGQLSAGSELSFAGAGAIHYAFALAMAVSILTCLTGVVLALRNRQLKRRWLWAIGSLFAFVAFELNWASEAVSVQPVSFLLLGAAATKDELLAPWTVSFAIPVIAIIVIVKYLRRHRTLAETFEPAPQAEA